MRAEFKVSSTYFDMNIKDVIHILNVRRIFCIFSPCNFYVYFCAFLFVDYFYCNVSFNY